MNKRLRNHLVLIGIVVVALLLRIWQIGAVPPSPDWDEASLGYNAYSILKTGKDEYGKLFPFVLESFGDFKPALYVYLIIPLLPIFDLSLAAVRLPSVIFGVIAVVVTYFIVKELFRKERLALLSALLLAVSPWHIQFSRVAFESNVGLTFNLLIILFFLIGLRKNWVLILSGVCAALSIYTYQSEKVFVPLLLATLVIVYFRQILIVSKKYLVLSVLALIVISLPMVHFTLTNEHGLQRAKATSVFSSKDDLLKYSIQKLEHDNSRNDLVGKIFDNRRVEYGKLIIAGYLSHFDFNWLFIEGDGERHHAPFMGLLYLWELPFFLIGLYAAVFYAWVRKHMYARRFLFAWVLIAPIPAAITNDVPHAVRTLNFLPTFQIFTAIGILAAVRYFAVHFMQHAVWKRVSIGTGGMMIMGLIGINFLYYLNQYFVQQNYFYSKFWQYGYKEAVKYVEKESGNYEKIIVSDRVPMDQSYIFFLYYLKYSPAEYQKERGSNHSFGKFEFRPIEWSQDKELHNTLLVGDPGMFPEQVKPDKTIYYINGEKAISITGIK